MTKLLSRSLLGISVGLVASSASAVIVVYRGLDLTPTGRSSPRPLSSAAQSSFLAHTSVAGTETFESADEAWLDGDIRPGVHISQTGQDPDSAGVMADADGVIGFNTTVGGSKSYEIYAGVADATVNIKFKFATPVNSFGAYITGFDTKSTVANVGKIQWTNSLGAQSVLFTNTSGLNNAQYLGFIDKGQLFTEVTVTVYETGGGRLRDTLQLDDVSYGVAAVPEPMSLCVFGAGILAFVRKRR